MKIIPQNKNILVKQVFRKKKETTAAGLLKIDIKEIVCYYEVVAIGKDVESLKVGDIVISSIHIGLQITVDDDEFRLMRDSDIWAVTVDFERA